jgi:hypothetical protein
LYAVWNNELKVTAVGGEDSISDLHRSKLVGSVRTYVHLGDRPLNAKDWFARLRSGHAYVSTGPITEFTVNGKIAGEVLEMPTSGSVQVEVQVRSIVPLNSIQLVRNGAVIEEIPPGADPNNVSWKKSVAVKKSGWVHLRVSGDPGGRFPLDSAFAQSFTNPVWIVIDGQPIRNQESADYCIRWIDKLREMAEEWPGWRSEKERKHVFAQFDEARQIYLRLAEEATDH